MLMKIVLPGDSIVPLKICRALTVADNRRPQESRRRSCLGTPPGNPQPQGVGRLPSAPLRHTRHIFFSSLDLRSPADDGS